MKKLSFGKLIIVFSIVIVSGISIAFLGTQETRDFRIGKNLDIFFSLFRELNTFYVDEINPDKILKAGIDNMLKTLDPYTVYYPESEIDEFTFMTTGKYGGIGSMVRSNGEYAVITEVYRDFPADKAGLKPGDIIKKVDGVSLSGIATDKVSDRLKGDPGTPIALTVERNGKDTEYSMKRERIVVPPVPYSGMIDQNTGYIRFRSFTQNCIDAVKSSLISLKTHNPKQIILDLRGNPGGLLTEAVEIVNLFVDPGKEVVSTKGKVKQFDSKYKTTKSAIDDKISLAVIIDRGSASASEIVAGAIQDLDRGIIIGQRSYGKGLVQITRPLSYNTQLKVTTAKYYIPSGRCIQAVDFSHPNEDGSVGVIPDSLISEFKTTNGRIVKNGGGITPDVEVLPETLSQLSSELYVRNYIFDFATQYYWSHSKIKDPDQFNFSAQDYTDFKNYLIKKNFDYRTNTEQSFKELVSNAKKEKNYDSHKDTFMALEKEITHHSETDLIKYKEEITELLSEEIIGRYFYEDGAIKWNLKTDEQVLKAIDILNNKEKYSSILNGKSGSIQVAGKVNGVQIVRLPDKRSVFRLI